MTEVTSVKGHALTNILRKSAAKVQKYARKARGCPKYVVEQSCPEYVVEQSIDISAG
jgi:predicted transcriptional regulator